MLPICQTMSVKVKVKRKVKPVVKPKPKYRLNKSNLQKVSIKVQAPKAPVVYPAFGAGGSTVVVTQPSSSNDSGYEKLLAALARLDASGPLARPGVMVHEPYERTERFVQMSPLNLGTPAAGGHNTGGVAMPLQTQPERVPAAASTLTVPTQPMDVAYAPGSPMATQTDAELRGQTVRPASPPAQGVERPRRFVRTNGETPIHFRRNAVDLGNRLNLDIPLQIGPNLSPHNGRIVPYAGGQIVPSQNEDDDL